MQLLACSIAALIAAISNAASANAQTGPSLVDKVDAAIDAAADRLTDIFKDLHRNPEIAFTEFRTAAIVAKELEALGYEVTTGIGGTWVVGVLRNGSGPTLWYRADMDANGGLVETTGLDYAASGPQRVPDGTEVDAMHACGHDAHVLGWRAQWRSWTSWPGGPML